MKWPEGLAHIMGYLCTALVILALIHTCSERGLY